MSSDSPGGGTRAAGAGPPAACVLDGVGFAYPRRGGRALEASAVSLASRPARSSRVVGPCGCGKSTLLELVCGLQAPDARHASRAAPAVLMPQRDLLLPWLERARQRGARAAHRGRVGATPRARGARRRCSSEFGLGGLRARAARTSCRGGMRQRVAFLRTLLAGKPVLCLDEPFGALDALTRAEMQALARAARSRASRAPCCSSRTTSRRRCVLADRVVVLSPRPARVRRRARRRPAAAAARAPTPALSRCASARWRRCAERGGRC